MMVQMQFGVDNHSQIFDAVSAYSRGFTQFVLRIKQVGFSREGNNCSVGDIELPEIINVPSMNTIYNL